MALEVGAVVARLGAKLDDDGFDRFERRLDSVRREARNDVDAKLGANVEDRGFRRYEQQVDRAERSSKRLSGAGATAARGLGMAATGAAAAAGGAAIIAKQVIESASDIAESTSKIKTVLGDASGELLRFAETSAKSYGISKQAALEATGTLAALFKNFGQTDKAAAASSLQFTKLAADMASFNNTSPAEAIEALGAGLRGEAEPLRRYGVLLDDASLKAQAVRDGLIKTTKTALTPQTRALAAQNLILKQTTTQQGDFARTQGGMANQTKILQARIKDLGAELGQKLLPHALKGVEYLNKLADGFKEGRGPGGRLRDTLRDVGETLKDVFENGKDVVGFLDEHKAMLKGAATAWLGYKAAIAATATAAKLSGLIGVGAGGRRGASRVAAPPAMAGAAAAAPARGGGLLSALPLIGGFAMAVKSNKDEHDQQVDRSAKAIDRFDASVKRLGITQRKREIPALRKQFQELMHGLDYGSKESVDALERFSDATHKASTSASQDFKDIHRNMRGRWRDIKRDTTSNWDDIEDQIKTNIYSIKVRLGKDSAEGRAALARNFKGARGAIRDAMKDGTMDVDDGMRKIRQLMVKELKAYGLSGGQAREYLSGHHRGGSSDATSRDGTGFKAGQGAARGGYIRRASGGWIGGRGMVSDDVVPIAPGAIAAWGEYDANGPGGRRAILNRHQTPIAEAALAAGGYPGLDRLPAGGQLPILERALAPLGGLEHLFRTITRPHYLAAGGIVPIPGQPGESIFAPILPALQKLISRYNLRITDGYAATGHATNSDHKWGGAVDIVPGAGGSWSQIDALARYAEPTQGRPRAPFRWVGYTGDAGHGSGNHLHLSWSRGSYGLPGGPMVGGGGGGGADASQAKIPRVLVDTPGALGGLAQRGLDMARGGATARMRKIIEKFAPAAVGGGDFAGPQLGADANVVSAFRRAARTLRANPMERLALFEAGIVESGLRNLDYGDRDSVGALQQRASQGWTGLQNPYNAAREFLTRAMALRPWRGTAGHLAQAVQRSAFPERYDQVAASARRYLTRGGRLRRFGPGGYFANVPITSSATVGAAGSGLSGARGLASRGTRDDEGSLDIRALRKRQPTRIAAYEAALAGLEGDSRLYGQQERRIGFDTRDLVNDETGALDLVAIEERTKRYDRLVKIRERVLDKLRKARRIVDKVVRTYTEVVRRLKRGRASTKKKSKIKKYDKQIEAATGIRNEWRATARDVGFDVVDARMDVREVKAERAAIRGEATLESAGIIADNVPEPPEPPELGGPAGGGEPAAAAATPAEVAAAALAALGTFQAARAELFGGMGSNYRAPGGGGPGGVFAGVGQQAAGTRYLGGEVSGTDRGSVAGAGGVVQHITFTGPAPVDPHTFTQAALHELRAAV